LWVAGLVLAGISGCATTSSLSNMWKDPTSQLGPMKSVLVISMKPDPARRRLWEDGLATKIAKYGTTATPSYRLFPDRLPDTAAVVEAVRRDGYDGVLVISKADTTSYTNYVPGYTDVEPVARYNPWTYSYQTSYISVTQPGYEESGRIFRHEIHLWTTKEGGRMVWAATGESINPASSEDVLKECEKLVLPQLSHAGFIGK
jgi:hypothetical protein